ncbi:MAG: hypothetical protein PHI39_02595 [Kiritimatiellae bacterium]|jgi:hypothetical protein|nr:hypothetical protein [Kiritimatiellia bacterium]
MFKWPGAPSPHAQLHELADFTELIGWQRNRTSATALSALLGRLDENDYTDGVPEESETDEVVKGAYMEIERRREACRNGYPYVITEEGYTIRDEHDDDNHKHIVYKYLLLATRLNMRDNRMHADIDGSLLFEELAAEVAREYLGTRAESVVFGTAAGTADFPGKVDALCQQMREGVRFVNRDDAPPTENDGKLDVVVWKHFTDGLAGKLIAFGQCKTGTDYKNTLTQLQPDTFCKKWLHSSPAVPPVRMFFVSEALSRCHWQSATYDAGVLFDRCRIVDFCDNICEDVILKLKTWTQAAEQATVKA